MITTKLFLYDSNATDYKGTEYSQYILSGNSYKEDLTEVLDTCEITLAGVPFKEEFAPTTKFIMELWTISMENNVIIDEQKYETYSLCVSNDVVTKPILSDDNYYNHSISFTEASIVAQQRIVDNFSETYELKDVSIDVAPTYEIGIDAEPKQTAYIPTAVKNGETFEKSDWVGLYGTTTTRFTRKYEFDFRGVSSAAWSNIDKNKVIPIGGASIDLPIPLIKTAVGSTSSSAWDTHYNFCSVVTRVYRKVFGSNEWGAPVQEIYTNPNINDAEENDWQKDWAFTNVSGVDAKGYGTNRIYGEEVVNLTGDNEALRVCYYKKFADFDSVNPAQNRTIHIDLVAGCNYRIEVTLADNLTTDDSLKITNVLGYTTQKPDGNSFSVSSNYSVEKHIFQSFYLSSTTTTYITNDAPKLSLEFNTYAESASTDLIFASAPPVSAYDLFVDAQLKSQQTYRDATHYIRSDTYLQFYCNQEDTTLLKNTAIIESSYHQKNLWEVLLEIGKYIHSIPYIEFGEDNRFLVSWHRLGDPTQYADKGTTMSIYNSRSLENYISAVNSYVTNMIQLGGQINEWVAPKSESEDFLVYNDVATIKTTKPMIEILQLGAKNIRDIEDSGGNVIVSAGQYVDLTNYVFEKSVYDMLDITGDVVPNKGLALYYNLGENVIRGLNYQMPAKNVGDPKSDYAIKRILGQKYSLAEAESKILRIYDFIFFVKYRTKESIRSEQSRPDLRKYLINGVYDTFPIHRQFNNQQDVSVDSVKFGNQVYGKLIKTGNTEIKTTEWCDTLDDIKHVGQLIEIYGNLYYVAEVQHIFYQDHIESEITYSKDYNQLSEIIGIPSEPRFYEISERNLIDRYVNANSLLKLTTSSTASSNSFVNRVNNVGMTYIKDLLFVNETKFPQFVLTQFKNDELTTNTELANLNTFCVETIHPISGYSMRNTLSLKWEMETNFSAGERSVDYNPAAFVDLYADGAYAQLIPVQYCDGCGRADLYDFAIIKDLTHPNSLDPNEEESDLTSAEIQNQPLSPYRIKYLSRLITCLGKAKTYSTSGLIDLNINPNINSYFLIGNGSIKDENGVVLATKNSNVGDYVYVIDSNDTGAIYYCSGKTSSNTAWTRMLLMANADYSEIINTPAVDLSKVIFGSGINDNTFGSNAHGLALAKDNRERLIFNFNTQMLTESDRFVLSGYMWRQEKSATIKVALLTEEVNKITNDTIDFTKVIRKSTNANEARDYTLTVNVYNNYLHIPMSSILNELLSDSDLASQVKAIAIYSTAVILDDTTQKYFVMARNVSDLSTSDKIADWYITSAAIADFPKQ